MQDDNCAPSKEGLEEASEAERQEEPQMDVSPPHHPVHNWRDALVHLAIVTAGLFIALMLESVVEWIHHKTLVREARQNIAVEIRHNRKAVKKDLAFLAANLSRVDANIRTLRQLHKGREFHGSLINKMDYDELDVAAWRTARDTGALGYMPYNEVQLYSGLYTTIDYVNSRALAIGDAEFKALAPAKMGYDIGNLPDEERTAMLRANAESEIELITLQQMLQEVDHDLGQAAAARSPN
jgi:hypothetical protein